MNCSTEGIVDSSGAWFAFRILLSGVLPIFGICGNILVILVIGLRKISLMRTNIFLLNLAVADLLFCIQNIVFSLPAIILNRYCCLIYMHFNYYSEKNLSM